MLTVSVQTRLGNYILEEQIGAGTFGEAWKAHHHERPGQWVAVKIAAEEHRRQLRREGRFPHIQHPNVVPIIDSDTRGEVPYVVMPLMAGSLADLIAQHGGGLPEDRVEALLRDILAGLAAIQAGGIEAHRDVKPRNILLDAKGRAVVSDFGLSLSAPGLDQSQSVLQSGEDQVRIAGTPAYMAPEVRKGQAATAASDVYAVGAVLFEMLAGRGPEGAELPSLCRKDLRRPAFWDALFYWSYRPLAERYPDAAAMLKAVDRGPKPVPFAPGPADAPPLNLPPPAPLPDELWEALAVRWEERERLSAWLAEHRGVISETLKEYAEPHRHVRGLRQQEAQIVGELKAADERLRAVCGKIVAQLEKETAPLKQRRDNLLAEGCLPNHRDVEALDRQIAPYDTLRGRVERLPTADGSHPLVPCLVEWVRVRAADALDEYEMFLTRFGDGISNPWAAAAAARIEDVRKRTRLAGLLKSALLGTATGGIYWIAARNARQRQRQRKTEIAEWLRRLDQALAAKDGLAALAVLTHLQRLLPRDSRIPSWRQQVEALPKPKNVMLDLGDGVKLELVPIPAGEFMMGSPDNEEGRASDEGPQHRVRFGKAFYMGKYEITVGQFRRFVEATGYRTDAEKGGYTVSSQGNWDWQESASWRSPGFEQKDSHPVVLVSWNDAKAFCDWLSGQAGRRIRLPAESEWEYACRAGTTTRYWWGNAEDASGKVANVADRRAKTKYPSAPVMDMDDGYVYTAPCRSYRANGFGLHDMIGNVWEWCEDVWHDNYEGAPGDGSAWTSGGDQTVRVLRGGSWDSDPHGCRAANRHRYRAAYLTVGVRVAMDF